ncbi:putative vegetative incompatibility HET containing-domain protein [Staphylotrichum tortipilum]|uniref:Vegetative incompatibility HET containing-domain protein n=1 Tax=Staphylotrichum tortipilum TaxID=2831512 RepID=A0AAN6MD02_9PEZI|nr:putative vegetative incompatibility HET containing-domain protein [Staphylotrichum longicolle]
MWLLNCSNFRLESHNSKSPPDYWILSHTWEADEVTFQDMQDLTVAALKKGFRKIEGMCKLASARRVRHVWIDTCCIDKTSSAELSESINSMFNWYRNAMRCIAFLADLAPTGGGRATEADLENCRWFTRGWTLQELLAPDEVEFYDRGWNPRGTRRELCYPLSSITNIDSDILVKCTDSIKLQTIPVATRLSWAAHRQTTRVEDEAYCLLGIVGVHMPLLYGEGTGAFLRLQETILQKGNDMSLFAWVARSPTVDVSGLLASDPSQFAYCGEMARINSPLLPPLSWAITNAGLETTIALDRPGAGGDKTEYTAITRTIGGTFTSKGCQEAQPWSSYRLFLRCGAPERHHAPSAERVVLAIWLRKTSAGFVRYKPTELCAIKPSAMKFEEPRLIRIATFLSTQQLLYTMVSFQHPLGFAIKALRFSGPDFNARDARLACWYHPPHLWENERVSGLECMTVSSVTESQLFSVIEINISSLPGREPFSRTCWLLCGLVGGRFSTRPWAELVCEEADGSVALLGGRRRCHRSSLTNPFALFALQETLSELDMVPATSRRGAECVVRCTPTVSCKLSATDFVKTGGGDIRLAYQAAIMAGRADGLQ